MGLFSSKKSKNKYATVTSKSKLSVDVIENNQWKKCNKCNEIKAIDKFGVTKVPKVTLNYKNKK